MNDPYLNFDEDLSNIQVNVFHVKDPLRGMSPLERKNYIHNDVIIFNPENEERPEIHDIN